MVPDPLRDLPAVSRLLAHPKTERLLVWNYVVQGCSDILDELRRAIGLGQPRTLTPIMGMAPSAYPRISQWRE